MQNKNIIWVIMILLALWQRSSKLEFFIFEIIIYLIIMFVLKIFSKNNSIKNRDVKYKYEILDNNCQSDNKLIEEIYWEQIDIDVKDAADKVQAKKDRIASYDFREFEGRKNVDWIEVYDYLWLQCRYKGIRMWNEYISELISKGVIQEHERKLIINKAGNYIPWNPRMDLEELDKYKRNEVKKKCDENDAFIRSMKKFNQKLLYCGGMSKDFYDFTVKEIEKSDSYLKTFDYEEYLKRKGYV